MLTIAVDAMGGDHAPKAEVEGAVRAARDPGCQSHPGGPAGRGPSGTGDRTTATSDLPIEIVHASEVVTMEDSAARGRPLQTRLAPCGWPRGWCAMACAQGFVSAGNTGAVMATAKMVQGVVPGRGAAGAGRRLPHRSAGLAGRGRRRGRQCGLLAGMLAQFAVMGEIYSRMILPVRSRAWEFSPSAKRTTRATN